MIFLIGNPGISSLIKDMYLIFGKEVFIVHMYYCVKYPGRSNGAPVQN